MSDLQIKNNGCIIEACRLKLENENKGSVHFVSTAGKVPIDHAYYVPDETRLDDIALNQTDNGYPNHPQLKVHEVLEYGTRYF